MADLRSLTISRRNGLPIFLQIKHQVIHDISKGELVSGQALPSIRQAAKQFGVTTATVRRAYAVLEEEGFVVAHPGKGVIVCSSTEEALAAVKLAYDAGGGAINDVDANGETALHGAVYRGGAIPVIEFLVERGAVLDAVNAKGWTPVTVADGVEYTPAVLKRYPEAAALLRRMLADRGLPVPPSTQPGHGG